MAGPRRFPADHRQMTGTVSSLSRQLVLPVAGLVLAAVLANVGFSAWLATQRSLAAARAGQEQVAAALEAARIALSPQVLDTLQRLTGSHFVVWNPAARTADASTLPAGTIDDRRAADLADTVGASAVIDGRRYRIGLVRASGVRPESVLVLTPLASLARTAFDAAWPVLAVAAATLAVLVPIGLRTTGRLARRIGAVERHVGRIAAGDFGRRLEDAGAPTAAPPVDELGRLVDGVNRMSTSLGSLRDTLVAGERQRLLGQPAAGFAHELRNAITGARLAIELHRRRCPGSAAPAADDSLGVAVRQLDIVAEEVRGLLALGRPAAEADQPGAIVVADLFAEILDLTGPRSDHAGVHLDTAPTAVTLHGRHDSLRAALVNLVLNAIDAAGAGGKVSLAARAMDRRVDLVVEDTGPGPPEAVRAALMEPFVTGKPEGIGLGLAVAKAVAEAHGGTLSWSRADGRTRFAISLPEQTLAASAGGGHLPGNTRS